jgi:hypothetical protein
VLDGCASVLTYTPIENDVISPSHLSGGALEPWEQEPPGFTWCAAGDTTLEARDGDGRGLSARIDASGAGLTIWVDGAPLGVAPELTRPHWTTGTRLGPADAPRRETLRVRWMTACRTQLGWLLAFVESVKFRGHWSRIATITFERVDLFEGRPASVATAGRLAATEGDARLSQLAMGLAPDGRVALRVVEGGAEPRARYVVGRLTPDGRVLFAP